MNTNSVHDYLMVLKLMSFDENLFRKEFKKTLTWITPEEFHKVEVWMYDNKYHTIFPGLVEMLKSPVDVNKK